MENNIKKVFITGANGFIGKTTDINPLTMIMLSRPSADYSHAKATRLLGYRPKVALAEGMRRCEAWLQEQGMVP